MPLALVTGSNRGLGFETCRQLIEQGCDVIGTARQAAAATAAAEQLGSRARFLQLDVTDAESVAALRRALSDGPALDILINNAGASFRGFDLGVVEKTLEVNFRGVIQVTDALLPQLAPSASIVMVSSGMGELSAVSPELKALLLDARLNRQRLYTLVNGFVESVRGQQEDLGGWPKNAYAASKIALNAFTRILDRELDAEASSSGRPRVNAVCPGWVRTRLGGASAPTDVSTGARGIVELATWKAGPSGSFFRDGRAIAW